MKKKYFVAEYGGGGLKCKVGLRHGMVTSTNLFFLYAYLFMSIEGSAKFVYEYPLVLVVRIEVSLIFVEFMGINKPRPAFPKSMSF